MIKIKDALPARYFNQIYFTITKLEHTVTNHDWKLNVTAIARIQESENQIGYKLSEDEMVIPPLRSSRFENVLVPPTTN